MRQKLFLCGMLAMALVFGMMVAGCPVEEEPEPVPQFDNAIYSVSIGGGNTPKVGSTLRTTVENASGSSVSGVSYQWKRADTQYSTFVNITDARSSSYTPTIDDANKYIRVEVTNDDTASPVLSNVVGPVDSNQVATPTVNIAGGEVMSGQGITLATTTENASIYYTLDGTTPTSSSTRYSSSYPGIRITSNCTLKAIATRFGMVDSEILSVTYTVASGPSFSAVTSSALIFNKGIYSVAYGNNRFVAGGNGRIAYSTNGTTWTDATGNINLIVYGMTYGTQFVAVGRDNNNGVINYSSDGTSWTDVSDTAFTTGRINDVAYGSGRYVAVGGYIWDSPEKGEIAYSTNGSSWTAVTDTTFETSCVNGITYGAGKFVAVGAGGKIAYSTDGTTWTAVADSPFVTTYTDTIEGITYGGPAGNEKFIAVSGGLSPNIAYSTDGITWTRCSSYFDTTMGIGGFNRVAWGGNKYVAVGGEGVMYFSLDGTYWAKIDGGTGAGKTQFDTNVQSYINDIAYGGGKFLAVGQKYVSGGIFGSTVGEMAISD